MSPNPSSSANTTGAGSSPSRTVDVAIIGAGTAGLAAARSVNATGAKFVIVDPEFRGTMCANTGCMPSKLLIAAAKQAHAVRASSTFGIEVGAISVNSADVLNRVRSERDNFAHGIRSSLSDFPPEAMIKSHAKFISPNTLELDDGTVVSAGAIVIAVGSEAAIPKGFERLRDLVLTNETIFELDALPPSMAVVGAGPIGLELSQALARLNVEVTVFDDGHTLGGVADSDVQQSVRAALGKDVELVLGVQTQAQLKDNKVSIEWSGDSQGVEQFDRVLIAAGRLPPFDGLGLEHSGLDLDDNGVPSFDAATMRCGQSSIFIAGDCTAERSVLHEASREGEIAGQNAARVSSIEKSERSPEFAVVFTDPPLARVGEIDKEDAILGSIDFSDQGRAKMEGTAVGTAKIWAEADTGKIIGAALFCPSADHLAHYLELAIIQEMTAKDCLQTPFYHPTYEEGLKTAFEEIASQCANQTG